MKNINLKTRIFAGILFIIFCLGIIVPLCLIGFIPRTTHKLELEQIMEKERPVIESLGSYDINTGNLIIEDYDDFIEFRDAVNMGTSFVGTTVVLENSIDFKNKQYIPIGITSSNFNHTYFSGTFDGNGLSLTNISAEIYSGTKFGDYTNSDLGVFGFIYGATIKNLTVTIGTINQSTADYTAGGLVGSIRTSATIQNVLVMPASSNSIITRSDSSSQTHMHIGGIVGYMENVKSGLISKCANLVKLENKTNKMAYVGGIVGRIASTVSAFTISECYNGASITGGDSSSSGVYAGGIVGRIENSGITILNCCNKGDIYAKAVSLLSATSARGNAEAAGVLRNIDDIKIDCVRYNTWENYEREIYAGGICGNAGGATISYCYNNSNTDAKTSYVSPDAFFDEITFFYGYTGHKTTGVSNKNYWYGDLLVINSYQIIENGAEIAFNAKVDNCLSNSWPYSRYNFHLDC